MPKKNTSAAEAEKSQGNEQNSENSSQNSQSSNENVNQNAGENASENNDENVNNNDSASGENGTSNETDSSKDNTPETSPEEPIVKSGARKIRIKELFGTYKDTHFDDEGICQNMSDETFEQLKKDFPEEVIETLD